MIPVFVVSDNIVSPLGNTAARNFALLKEGRSGIQLHDDAQLSAEPFYASLFKKDQVFLQEPNLQSYSTFEQLLIVSIADALQQSDVDITDEKTALIISSTKGNISMIETAQPHGPAFPSDPEQVKRVSLPASGKAVANYFHHPNQPIVVSNACISGLLALLTGLRLIRSGRYKHAVVAGCDLITRFILSGFQSFQAISAQPCRPFDEERNGITLGEAAATIILSGDEKYAGHIRLVSGAVSNDANHISGPSRTGEELYQAIAMALTDAGLTATDIDFISAHGTATIYNDEMEAKAISLAGMEHIPVNSLKGNYGHTLGAAGLIECVISIHALQENLVFPTAGFKHNGVTKPLHICRNLQRLAAADHFLKTASGFGGCNAALVFSK